MGSANISIVHSKTLGTAKDSSAYDINSPEWNAAHLSTISNIDADSLGGKAASAYLTTQSVQSAVAQINGSSGSISFVAGNNITLSTAAGVLSIHGASGGAGSTYNFSNSNNVSFGLNGSTVTASASFSQSVQPALGAGGVSGGNTSGTSGTYTGSIMFAGGNNITLSAVTGVGGQTITISGPNVVGAQTGISGIAGSGASTATSGTVQFANSNGLTFGLNGNTITASHNGLTAQSSLVFSNLNNVTFGTNGSTLTASVHAQQTGVSGICGSNASTATSGTVQFANSNGLTFGLNGNTITGSVEDYSIEAGSNVTLSTSGASTTIIVGGGVDSYVQSINGSTGAIVFTAGSNITLSQSQSTITIIGASGGVGGGVGIYGSGTGTVTSGDVQFANSNGLTFGLSGSTITASHNGLTTAMASDAGSKFLNTGTTGATNCSITLTSNGLSVNVHPPVGIAGSAASTVTAGTIAFANSNGISFGLNGSTMTASHNALTAQSSLVFSNLNNVTFGTNGSTLTASVHAQQTGISGLAGSAASTVTAGTVQFANSNGLTFGLNGSTMTASHNGLTNAGAFLNVGTTHGTNCSITLASNDLAINVAAGGGAAISAAGASASNGTVVISNSNNVSFGMNGSTITASASFASTTINSYNGGIGNADTVYTSGTVYLSAMGNCTINSSVNGASQYLRISAGLAHNFVTTGGSTSWVSSGGTATNQAKLVTSITIQPNNSDNHVALEGLVVVQLTTTGAHTFNFWRSNSAGQTVIGFPMIVAGGSASFAGFNMPVHFYQIDSPAAASAITYNLYCNDASSKTMQVSGALLRAMEFG